MHAPPLRQLQEIRFGEYLVERHALTEEQFLDVLADHWANGGRFGAAVSRKGILGAEAIEALAAEYHAIKVVDVSA
jgi:hypothetical protein